MDIILDLEPWIIDRLASLAAENNRSLEDEIKACLQDLAISQGYMKPTD